MTIKDYCVKCGVYGTKDDNGYCDNCVEQLLEASSDIAEKATEEICKALKMPCWEKETSDSEKFTEEAQDIYNDFIDLTDKHLKK